VGREEESVSGQAPVSKPISVKAETAVDVPKGAEILQLLTLH
jgi:hypothetical protein